MCTRANFLFHQHCTMRVFYVSITQTKTLEHLTYIHTYILFADGTALAQRLSLHECALDDSLNFVFAFALAICLQMTLVKSSCNFFVLNGFVIMN